MKNLTYILSQILNKTFLVILLLFFISFKVLSSENTFQFEIVGNQNTDDEVILSLIDKTPNDFNEEYSNYLLNQLNNSGLFKEIKISIKNNIYIINVIEYPIIEKIYFQGNYRFKDEELNLLANDFKLEIYKDDQINKFLNELKNIYSSFGYNDVKINLTKKINELNLATLFIDITENKITKIKSIKFIGNNDIETSDLIEEIKSKTKKLSNIFANNNFKPMQVDTDKNRLIRYYKNKGYADVNISYDVEFFANNTVILYFNIYEGKIYELGNINFSNETKNQNIDQLLSNFFQNYSPSYQSYNASLAENIEEQLSNLLKKSGIKFYEINKFVNLDNGKADLLFEIKEADQVYINNININGNTRTLDYVIRRELEVAEGDAF